MMVSVRKAFDGLTNTADAELLAVVTIICSAHVFICVLLVSMKFVLTSELAENCTDPRHLGNTIVVVFPK